MFSVAVCDDDELLCEKIEACLKAYQPQGLVRCESYYSGEKLYADMLRGETFDLIFLDIELKAMVLRYERNFRTKRRTSYIFPPNRSMRWSCLQSDPLIFW